MELNFVFYFGPKISCIANCIIPGLHKKLTLEFFCECRDSNPGLVGEKYKLDPCAMLFIRVFCSIRLPLASTRLIGSM